MDLITNLYNSFKKKAYQLWVYSTMRPQEKAAENEQQLQNIIGGFGSIFTAVVYSLHPDYPSGPSLATKFQRVAADNRSFSHARS